ncbi:MULTISPECIES: succinylglutamate desuccinylase/aspartoacylase family protein [unclassified Halorhodospira]|uniref:succinylglutamate desuccinylase/aspartoacylase family protein n=1 Tax=unclassified Halorhodospira TaxID=2626748 RepID=UPI001EE8342E|nr:MULTISPECIES: succinylglutamate desuccinylase/aspartoacylase family protein [unclassified Halorhodospira]MCG5540324.1 succinylglutamate desuccinylase/aspartoacylase family protein [Halorhodospira sp. M39old]MCG5545862.1 succinylglutamate desuccinylase/aspartoacylase family protein [Halorhodospira sp. M38]
MARRRRAPFIINEQAVPPGERRTVQLDVAQLYTHTPVGMPVHVVHGRRDGPTLCLSAAIHGDEINGIEIIRRVLALPQLRRMRGTLLAVPIVNVFGVLAQTRYLPDRRDLNRSFPGSAGGSLAARLAHLFMSQVLERASHAIDLHTGTAHRTNLPQIRANLDDPGTLDLARAFSAPVIINSDLRDGSLRHAADERGIPVLLYEAGEALRFDEDCIRLGVRGITGVMRELGMLPRVKRKYPPRRPVQVENTRWVRTESSGILRTTVQLGQRVRRGEQLGLISDPFGDGETRAEAAFDGIVIGRTNLPLVHEGDALFHVARVRHPARASEVVEELAELDGEEDEPS